MLKIASGWILSRYTIGKYGTHFVIWSQWYSQLIKTIHLQNNMDSVNLELPTIWIYNDNAVIFEYGNILYSNILRINSQHKQYKLWTNVRKQLFTCEANPNYIMNLANRLPCTCFRNYTHYSPQFIFLAM